ncbi:MAG: MFS transporter [Chloroflexota bacterium]
MQPLRYPRYRIALGISTLSWIALWLTNIAVVAGMLQGGRTSADIGLFQAAWTIAVPVCVIAGGLITDRFGPTISLRLGLAMEICGMLLMATAFSSNDAPLPPLLLAAMLVGGSDGLNSNGVNVLAGGVVPRELMSAAIGLLLLGLAAGRIVGGTVAGPAVAALGAPGTIYLCAGLVAGAWLLTLILGRIRFATTGTSTASSYLDLRPAMRWYRATPDARTVLTIGGLMAVLVYGYFALLPVVVADVLGRDTGSQGIAMAAGGVGVAVGALTMGPLARRVGVGRVLIAAVLGATAGLGLLALGSTAGVVLLAVTLLPAFTNVQSASANVVLQTLAPVHMRGRVVGLYSMTFSLLLPVGTVTAGWLGQRLGVRETLTMLALAMVALTLGLVARRRGLARDLAVAAPEERPAT